MFTMHPKLASDTLPLTTLPLCEVRLMNNRLFPWVILVPKLPGLSEIVDLSPEDRVRLMDEICLTSEVMRLELKPDKLNVAALGNVVPQLHIHVIARFRKDVAWNAPVWGAPSKPYRESEAAEMIARLRPTLHRTPHPSR